MKFRRSGSLIAAVGLAAATAVVLLPSQSAGADESVKTYPAAQDFATTAFSDPWDFSNPEDINLSSGPHGGPAKGIAQASVAGGVLSFTAVKGQRGYVSPLWGGYPGSFLMGRDGGIAANQIDTNVYKYVRIHAYVDHDLNAALQWFSCLNQDSSCIGGMPVYLTAGWNDFVALIANDPGLGLRAAWTGSMVGLRFAFNPSVTTGVQIDSISVTATDSTVPTSVGNQIWWTDGSVDPSTLVAGRATSVVTDNHLIHLANQITGTLNTQNKSLLSLTRDYTDPTHPTSWDGLHWYTDQSTTPIDISAFPAGSKFYSVPTAGGTPTLVAQIIGRPLPVVTSPSIAGCGSYAKQYLGHEWLAKRSDFKITSAKLKSFKPGTSLTAVNAKTGPKEPKNDPHFTLKLGRKGIDGTVWHRLTLVESYAGEFNLDNFAGGGTMNRVVWQKAGAKNVAQTDDLVEYPGKQAVVLDLNTDPKVLTEPDGSPGQRYTFNTKKITLLRFDPNEDKGSRVWTVYSVVLAKDCSATSTYNVTWQDNNLMVGTTATIWATSPKGTVQLPVAGSTAPLAETGVANMATVDVTPLKAYGKTSWTIQVQASNPSDPRNAPSIASSTGPLVVS